MDKLCRSCKELISEHARVCTYCGSPQTLFGHFAAALKWIGGIATVVSLVLAVNSLVGLSQTQIEKREALYDLVDAADQLPADGDYARAWLLYTDAEKVNPGSRQVGVRQEALVRQWLPNAQITGEETFTQSINKTLPVLKRALEPEQHLQLISSMAAEFSEGFYQWPLLKFLLPPVHEQVGDYEQSLANIKKLAARLEASHRLCAPVGKALQRLSGEQPVHGSLRSGPL